MTLWVMWKNETKTKTKTKNQTKAKSDPKWSHKSILQNIAKESFFFYENDFQL